MPLSAAAMPGVVKVEKISVPRDSTRLHLAMPTRDTPLMDEAELPGPDCRTLLGGRS